MLINCLNSEQIKFHIGKEILCGNPTPVNPGKIVLTKDQDGLHILDEAGNDFTGNFMIHDHSVGYPMSVKEYAEKYL